MRLAYQVTLQLRTLYYPAYFKSFLVRKCALNYQNISNNCISENNSADLVACLEKNPRVTQKENLYKLKWLEVGWETHLTWNPINLVPPWTTLMQCQVIMVVLTKKNCFKKILNLRLSRVNLTHSWCYSSVSWGLPTVLIVIIRFAHACIYATPCSSSWLCIKFPKIWSRYHNL